MRKITRDDQLKNRCNFVSDGRLFLVRCVACADAQERGKENWAVVVAKGMCAHCGWIDEESVNE